MRFDDMLTTVMAAVPQDAVARQVVWRQLVDILAQERRGGDPALTNRALAQLEALRSEVSPVVRASVARAVAQRTNSPSLVRYFAQDDPAIAAEVLRHATLRPEQWCALISEMPTSSRALLRERRDLPPDVVTALQAFGPADYALVAPAFVPDSEAPQSGITAIADVVARIEAFKARKAQAVASSVVAATDTDFAFETDALGRVTFTTAEPRAAIIGLDLSVAGEGWLCGVDGYAAGAFHGRSPFHGARLTLDDTGPLAGDWRFDGAPVFDTATGRFEGYHCTARRPRPDEVATVAPVHAPTHDSLRQMVHELRTPLNAIIGFAEMIERELFGPVGDSYRLSAAAIRTDGLKLLSAIEDIDLSARLDAAPMSPPKVSTTTDIAMLLTRVARDFVPLTDARQLHLRVLRPQDSLLVEGEAVALQRLLSRVMTLALGAGHAGEAFTLAAARENDAVRITVSHPPRHSEHHDADNAADESGALGGAPLLGEEFGRRLIEKLAASMQVKFIIADDAFALILRVAHDSAAEPDRILYRHDDERLP